MSVTVVRYRVLPGQGEDNEALVRDVYAELQATAPGGFRYATFALEDGVTFVHVAVTEGEAGAPLTSLPAFKRFQAGLRERCDEQPVVAPASLVGAFGFS